MGDRRECQIKIIEVVLLAVITVLFIFLIVYLLFLKPDGNVNILQDDEAITSTVSYAKIDSSKNLYYLFQGNKYEIYSGDDYFALNEDFDHQAFTKISYSYPVININNSEIIKLNATLKEQVLVEENKLEISSDSGCIYSKNKNLYIRHESIIEYKYQFSETDNFITLIELKTGHTGCVGGYVKEKVYNVFKENGTLVSNQDILNKYNYNKKDFLQKFLNYIDNNALILDENIEALDDIVIIPQKNDIQIHINIAETLVYIDFNGKNFSVVK